MCRATAARKAVERLVLEEACALHREVGAVELEHEAARDDQLVLFAHLAGECLDVALVRAIERVEHDRGDDAGRGGGHERLSEALRAGDGALEEVALGGGLREVRVGDLGHRLRRVVDPRGARTHAGQARHVVRMLGDVARHAPLARAAKAAHPLGRIGREADARLLAVVADVDADLELFGHDVAHRRLGLEGQGCGVDLLAPVLPDEQVAERGGARQATDVGRQDALFAAFHRVTHGADCTTSKGGAAGARSGQALRR